MDNPNNPPPIELKLGGIGETSEKVKFILANKMVFIKNKYKGRRITFVAHPIYKNKYDYYSFVDVKIN